MCSSLLHGPDTLRCWLTSSAFCLFVRIRCFVVITALEITGCKYSVINRTAGGCPVFSESCSSFQCKSSRRDQSSCGLACIQNKLCSFCAVVCTVYCTLNVSSFRGRCVCDGLCTFLLAKRCFLSRCDEGCIITSWSEPLCSL